MILREPKALVLSCPYRDECGGEEKKRRKNGDGLHASLRLCAFSFLSRGGGRELLIPNSDFRIPNSHPASFTCLVTRISSVVAPTKTLRSSRMR
jgi:hypothetical protein